MKDFIHDSRILGHSEKVNCHMIIKQSKLSQKAKLSPESKLSHDVMLGTGVYSTTYF